MAAPLTPGVKVAILANFRRKKLGEKIGDFVTARGIQVKIRAKYCKNIQSMSTHRVKLKMQPKTLANNKILYENQ
jgi:hypothetical protein